MLIVGLTGGIGAGKSTVAALLAGHGAQVIDLDAVGRQVIEPGGRAEGATVDEFGPGIVGADGAIDRARLAAIVFADGDALARLNAISHPAINIEVRQRLAALPDDSITVLDMALLAESRLGQGGNAYHYTFVITVEADPARREDRAVTRGSSRDDVRRRMAHQASDAQRRAVADVVIDNNGSRDHLVEQVDALWLRLESMR